VVDGLSYPEGGWLADDGSVWFVEYGAHKVRRLESQGGAVETTTFWESAGCGPAAVLGLGDGTVLVTCYDRNELVLLGPTARVVASWTADEGGAPLIGPNDMTGDGAGGAWVTVSGKFDVGAPATGSVYFLSPTGRLTKVASGLRYANGIAFDGKRGRLYVGEMLANRVWRAAVATTGPQTGVLESPLTVFADLAALAPLEGTHGGYLGPDGMKVDTADGRLYVAQYAGGRVLVLGEAEAATKGEAPTAKLLLELGDAPKFVTNVTLTPEAVYATAATDTDHAPYPGALVRWSRAPALGE
jgi:sugar lactone lactonase YvrE